jgi:PadR family transcriptional regulator, regulatory protein PadR
MGATKIRLTAPVLKVLGALMSNPKAEISGADVARLTKLPSGTLYPLLARLEQVNWVQSEWEDADPHELRRPRRRFYSVTALGSRSARLAFKEVASAIGGAAWDLMS